MSRLLAIVFCAVCISACEVDLEVEYVEYVYRERAAFDPALIDEVEVFIRDIAKRWELELDEKSQESLRFLHKDVENAFDMMAYIKGHERKGMVFWIGNLGGKGNLLSLSMDHYEGGLPRICVDRLHEELKSGLENRFGLELYPLDKSGRKIKEGEN